VKALLARGDLIEVNRRLKGSRSWLVWTPDRAADAGVEARRERHDQGAD
jgi:hypothetical protein